MASKKISQLTTGSVSPSLTGVTVLSLSGNSYQVPLSTLRKTLVDSGSHYFTGSQTISGSLNVTSEITASSFVGDGSQLTNLPITVDGQSSLLAYFTGSERQEITGSPHFHVSRNGRTMTLGVDAYSPNLPERFLVENTNLNIATFQASTINNYIQVSIKNFNSGSNASADLILWHDSTSETTGYLDLGINSTLNDGNSVGFGGDSYLYADRNDLYVGSMSTGSHGHLHLFGGGKYENPQITIFNDGTLGFSLNVIDTGSFNTIPSSVDGYKHEFSGSVKLNDNLEVSDYTILSRVSSSLNFADDSAAQAGGVPLGGLYRSGSFILIRLT